jgi:hypothetical protein
MPQALQAAPRPNRRRAAPAPPSFSLSLPPRPHPTPTPPPAPLSQAFLEAIYLFAHGLPTADLWQDAAWRRRLEALQVGKGGRKRRDGEARKH